MIPTLGWKKAASPNTPTARELNLYLHSTTVLKLRKTAPVLTESSLLQPFEHVVTCFLRAELRGEGSGIEEWP